MVKEFQKSMYLILILKFLFTKQPSGRLYERKIFFIIITKNDQSFDLLKFIDLLNLNYRILLDWRKFCT